MADSGRPPASITPASVADMLAEWERDNAGLVTGTTLVREIVVAEGLSEAKPPWAADPPDDLSHPSDPSALTKAAGACGYLMAAPGAPWSESLAGCRAVLVPGQSAVTPDDAGRVAAFVKEGGVLIAFAHASLLDRGPQPRDDYALSEVLGAHYGGPVAFDTEASRVEVTADSIWAPQYSPEMVIDGTSTNFWASIEAGPMPHWVQIKFGRPVTVARAEVKCRPGFLLQDLQIQCLVEGDWTVAAEVKDNTEPAMDCPFERPITTDAVRCFVMRESVGGKDRVIADVGEVTLFDEAGNRLIRPPYLIEARIADEAWAKANRSDRLVLRTPAVRIRPDGAKALASFGDPISGTDLPLCTRNQFGRGSAYLLAVPEGALGYEPEVWETLLRTFVGMPAVRHSGDENVLAFLRQGQRHSLIHVIDTAPSDSAERAREVIIRASTDVLGPIGSAELAPGGEKLEVRTRGQWLQFTVPMDPMASVLLWSLR